MRIAQIAPVWERVPPKKYGGIELIVHLLTEELVKRGHEVTLFATGDSITDAELKSWYRTAPPRNLLGNSVFDLLHVGQAFQHADEFDIIHNHAGYTGIALGNFVQTPVLTTLHGIFTDLNRPFFELYKNAVNYNSISIEQRRMGPKDLNYVGNVYNAIDLSTYELGENKKDYYIYISRISPLKGSDIAVDIALKAGIKLIMAGKIDPGSDQHYFETKIAPKVDGSQIIFKGEVSEEEKRTLFKEAKGFIFPLQWSEPFGLVMIEAMASGTPVISFPLGSVPELIVDGKTGFLANDMTEIVEMVKRVDEINPAECRKVVEEKFGVETMVNGYEEIYQKIKL